MTPAELAALLPLPAFPATGRELARVAGQQATAALITHWGGQKWPVPVMSELSRDDARNRYAELVALVGSTAAAQIVRHYGGRPLYVPNCKKVRHQLAQLRLVRDYEELLAQGLSSAAAVFKLGPRYGLSGRQIEARVNAPTSIPEKMQADLF
ncbi:MAG: hypothetical protein LBO00_01745 [Zoogloeaceae bacterium]|jgi:hypothetical protein|nr:hypothetical protein [Zoogloeaceae bacterium]